MVVNEILLYGQSYEGLPLLNYTDCPLPHEDFRAATDKKE
jgi:hypothetical protein